MHWGLLQFRKFIYYFDPFQGIHGRDIMRIFEERTDEVAEQVRIAVSWVDGYYGAIGCYFGSEPSSLDECNLIDRSIIR